VIRSFTLLGGLAIALGCAANSNEGGGVGGRGGSPSGAGGSALATDAATGEGGAAGEDNGGGGGDPGAGGDPGEGGDMGTGGTPAPCTTCCVTFGGAAHGTGRCMVLGPTYDGDKMLTKLGFLGTKDPGSNLHSMNFSFDARLRGMAAARSYAGDDLILAQGHIDLDTEGGEQLDFDLDATSAPPTGMLSVTLSGDGSHGTVDATLVDVDTGKMSATAHVTF
jgi:hypothetical protein